MPWPSTYPQYCPPDDSELPEGVFYHFIRNTKAIEEDFRVKAQKDPSLIGCCQAHGVSVFKNLSEMKKYRENYKSRFRNYHIGKITLNANLGLIKNTPSDWGKSHYTWWVPQEINPVDFCVVIEENNK